jgi:hypothetical protein
VTDKPTPSTQEWQRTFIRNTEDGRAIEVIGPYVCLAGEPVADGLTEVATHPNRRAILHTLPNGTHMAGPLVFTAEEASQVRGALLMAKTVETDPRDIQTRFNRAIYKHKAESGIE